MTGTAAGRVMGEDDHRRRAPSSDPASLEEDPPIRAALQFAVGGGRTFLLRQLVPYPFHITKPHYLDPAVPRLATLCLQSASGGLYRGDRLALEVAAAPCTAAHLTSQAATVVHTANRGIRVETRLSLARDSFLAFNSDPYILFPQTRLAVSTDIAVDASAVAIVCEGFDGHDPALRDTSYGGFASRTRVRDGQGTLLVDDDTRIAGSDLMQAASPFGPHRAVGSVLVLGRGVQLDAAAVERELDALGIFAAVSGLPNDAGVQIRLLAADGGRLSRGLRHAFVRAFSQRFGCEPVASRR